MVCPICFVWTSGCDNTDTSCLCRDPSKLIVGTEMRSRPYLALVGARPYFIISLVSCSQLSGQSAPSPGSPVQSNTRPHGGCQGSDGKKSRDGWRRTIAAVFVQLLHLFSALLLSRRLIFSNPQPPGKWFAPPRASFKPHYLQTM